MSSCIPLLILVIVSTVTGASTFKVGQYPPELNERTGANATFYCSFAFPKDISTVRVHWWKDAEKTFLNAKKDSRYQFEIRNKASAVFRLLNVDVSDSGTYYCRVEIAGKAGKGAGTRLQVTAHPDSPLIVPTLFRKDSAVFLKLACNIGGVHSKDLSVNWFVNGIETVTGIRKDLQPRSGGLFQISSYLEESQPAQNGTVYTCRVSYPDRQVQTLYTYISGAEDVAEQESDLLPWWIYICIGSGAFLLLLLVTSILCKFCVCRGKRRRAEKINVQEQQHMQQPANYKMAYTAVDFSNLEKDTKHQHMNKRPACSHMPPRNQQRHDKVIYATPQLKQHQGRKMGPLSTEPKNNKSVTSKKFVLQS
ncbi:uncharacterized protein [Heterodontus francisci]|uniref:uncharacterized protein isoform X1 n=1 Tax=Heterodontus francisci TaxID=7792 RepID=UPI00355AD24B